jgi:hypothetical protein
LSSNEQQDSSVDAKKQTPTLGGKTRKLAFQLKQVFEKKIGNFPGNLSCFFLCDKKYCVSFFDAYT